MKNYGELGANLKQNTREQSLQGIDFGRKTTLTFPYYEFYISQSNSGYVDPQIAQMYSAGMEVWAADKLPVSWLSFLNEVADARETKGIVTPTPPMHIIGFMIYNDEELAERIERDLNIEFFEPSEIQMNPELARKVVDYFLNDAELRARFKKGVVDFVYTSSATWVDNYDVIKFIDAVRLTNGLIVDLGCGVGNFTNDYARNGNKVIGIDRQYWDSHFSNEWKYSKSKNALFLQAEVENLPLASKSTDLVIATSIVGHLEEDIVTRMVIEAARILKTNGYMLIGPQMTKTGQQYRVFQMIDNQFIEISLNTLHPITFEA